MNGTADPASNTDEDDGVVESNGVPAGSGHGAAGQLAAPDVPVLLATYQALMARYNSLNTTRWQTLALGLTAQGFVVGAASQVQATRLTSAVMLSLVILFIGMATIVTGQRFELVALADRHMLDMYELRFLQGANEELRLHHSLSTGKRGRAMLRGRFLKDYTAELGKGGPYWLLNKLARLGPNHWWAYSQFTISVAGAAIPILRYFDL